MKFAITTILVFLGSSSLVWASWQDWSVWQKNQAVENIVVGKVKTIAMDDSTDRLMIKIKKQNGSVEVVHVCHEGVQSARNQIHGSPKLDLLKSAMARGQVVQLSYASAYDRCIRSVSIPSENIPSGSGIQKASHDFKRSKDI